jgi:hypothetical protein
MPKATNPTARPALRRNQVMFLSGHGTPLTRPRPAAPAESVNSSVSSLLPFPARAEQPPPRNATLPGPIAVPVSSLSSLLLTSSTRPLISLPDSGRLSSASPRQSAMRVFSLPLPSLPCPPHLLCSHPSEPQCSYDPVEGLTLAPDVDPVEKIRQLEDQISPSFPRPPSPPVHVSHLISFQPN